MRKTVDLPSLGNVLVITQWGALEGSSNVLRVGKLLGGSLAPIIEDAIKNGSLTKGVDVARIAEGLRLAEGADLLALIASLERATQVKMHSPQLGHLPPVALNADSYFAGEYAALLDWITTGVLFNFAGFTPSGPNAPTSPKAADAPGQ